MVSFRTLGETLPEVLRLIGEVLQRPAITSSEWEIVRKETLSELEQQLQDPMTQGYLALNRYLVPYPVDDIRYEPSTAERIERVQGLAHEDLREVHRSLYGSAAAELSLVGECDVSAIVAVLEETFGGWTAERPYRRIPMPFKSGVPAARHRVVTPGQGRWRSSPWATIWSFGTMPTSIRH